MESDINPKISGGPLVGKYEFVQLHYHWGSNDLEGSENTINNNRYTRIHTHHNITFLKPKVITIKYEEINIPIIYALK